MKKMIMMAMVAVMTLITCTSTVEWKDDDQNVTIEDGRYIYHGLDTFYLHYLVEEEGYRVEFTD